MQQPSKEQLQALLNYASTKLGVPASTLASAASSGGYEGLVASLSDSSRRTLENLLGDPQKAQALLASEQVRELLKRL